MEKNQLRKYGKVLLKILGTALALYFVSRKIDFSTLKVTLLRTNVIWLLLALVLYNASKLLSALRLNIFFRAIQVTLTTWFNIRLYYFGMFLNLFLPGGIGGDGFKAFYLTRRFHTSTRLIIASILKDRISGLAALVFLALLIFVFVEPDLELKARWIRYAALGALILCYPAYYLFTRLYFKSFKSDFIRTAAMSIGVQGIQVICAFALLKGLGVTDKEWIYLGVFLISSIVTIIPITVGGLGMRESVFLLASDLAQIDENKAVSVGFLFFVITAISSLIGVLVRLREPEIPESGDAM